MYDGPCTHHADDAKRMYAEFLADIPRFDAAMARVLSEWPLSCAHFLTKTGFNRVAWLGQAAMCMDGGISRKHRGGFMLLTTEQQQAANAAAERVLNGWLNAQQGGPVCCDVEAARVS
jgi:hypothetical protein